MSAAPKKVLLTALKVLGSAVAIYIVFDNVDTEQLSVALASAKHWWLLLPALGGFVVSKLIGAERLNLMFGLMGISLPRRVNLKLYWVGMYYNLFLPGGVGGDGYKAIWLKPRFTGSWRSLGAVLLFDRMIGVSALLALLLVICLWLPLPELIRYGGLPLVFIGYVLLHIIAKRLQPSAVAKLPVLFGQSIGVQLSQLITITCLLNMFGSAENLPPFLALFLASSVATLIPISVGGVGLRELVFLYGAELFQLDPATAVMVSFGFYLITAATSLIGGYWSFWPVRIDNGEFQPISEQ